MQIIPSLDGMEKIVSGELRKVEGPAARSGSSIGSKLGAGLKASVAVVGGAAGAILGTALAKGFGRLQQLETAERKMVGLGHSAEVVARIMDRKTGPVIESVRGTAFGLGEAALTASGALAAMVSEKEMPAYLKAVAQSAAAAQIGMDEMGSIFNKVRSNGKATNDVLGQVADRGLPIYQKLADQMGVTTEQVFKMASEGKIGFKEFETAMAAAGGTVADELGKTFGGTMANMGAALGRLGASFLGPLYEKLPGGITAITGWLDKLGPAATAAGEKVGAFIGDVVTKGTALFDLFRTGDFTTAFSDAFGVPEDSGLVDFLLTLRETFVTVYNEIRGGIEAFVASWKYNDGEITSSGFPAFMEVLGYWARQVFDYIRDVALPAIGGFIQGFRDGEGPGGKLREVLEAIGGAMKVAFEWFLAEGLPALQALWKFIVENLWPDIKTAFIDYIIPAFQAVAESVKVAWENWIQPALSAMWTFIRDTLAPFLADFYENGVKPTFKLIADAISFAWNYVIKPVFENLGGGLSILITAFTTTKDAIGRAWDGIVDKIKGPLNTARMWINDNFIDPLNSLFKTLKLDFSIPRIGGGFTNSTSVSTAGGVMRASGGVLPGYAPGRDDHLFYSPTAGMLGLSGGEAIMRPEWTRAIGKRTIDAWNAAARGGGVAGVRKMMGFAGGGVIDWVKKRGTDIIDLASSVGKVLSDPIGAIKDFADRALNGLGDTPLVQAMVAAVRKIVASLGSKIRDNAGDASGIGVGAGAMPWGQIYAMIKAVDPSVRMTSAYRPGAITASGAISKHGLGRAVDVVSPNMMSTFNRIRPLKAWTELYYSPAEWRQLLYGKPHRPTGITRQMHFNHIHAAMAKGGILDPFVADAGVRLAPGINVLHNRTGRPEPLTRADTMPTIGHLDVRIDMSDLEQLHTLRDFLDLLKVRSVMIGGLP